MKTIVVRTSKVVSHKGDGMPELEVIDQKISPEVTFNKFIEFLPIQNYSKAEVIRVLEDGKELDEVEKYQEMVNKSLKPDVKFGDSVDYKALSEKQSEMMARMEQRLAALEEKKEPKATGQREAIESKANELNISFRSNIGDEKLLDKIREIEPNFEL